MAIKLVAILLVLAACRTLPDMVRLRDFSWLHAWLEKIGQSSAAAVLVLAVGLPALLCALVQAALDHVLFGLIALVFSTLVLYFCWGPRDLERDVEAAVEAPDAERRAAALRSLRGSDAAVASSPETLVETVFAASLSRWFGVVFWFVVLGPAGALLYRLAQLIAWSADIARDESSTTTETARRLAAILDWAPAHLMALCLALASNFDVVFKTWHDYHLAHGGYFTLDLGFLAAIARASVDADVAAEDHEVAAAHNPAIILEDAMVLVRRVLVVWLTLIALIVIGRLFT